MHPTIRTAILVTAAILGGAVMHETIHATAGFAGNGDLREIYVETPFGGCNFSLKDCSTTYVCGHGPLGFPGLLCVEPFNAELNTNFWNGEGPAYIGQVLWTAAFVFLFVVAPRLAREPSVTDSSEE